jgi:spindle assembly abnormal protein 6
LRIHISSESDLFFLHSLEVSEEDFQSLKNEQGILVDFASFPGKVITLLNKCINSLPTDAPRYVLNECIKMLLTDARK